MNAKTHTAPRQPQQQRVMMNKNTSSRVPHTAYSAHHRVGEPMQVYHSPIFEDATNTTNTTNDLLTPQKPGSNFDNASAVAAAAAPVITSVNTTGTHVRDENRNGSTSRLRTKEKKKSSSSNNNSNSNNNNNNNNNKTGKSPLSKHDPNRMK